MHRLEGTAAVVLALAGLAVVSTSDRVAAVPPEAAPTEASASRLAASLRGATFGTRFPKATLHAAWPSTATLWKGEELEVINVLEGSPLSPGIRLLVVAPESGPPMHYGLLLQSEGRVEPIFCPLEGAGGDTFAASLAKERAWTRLHEEAVTAPEAICARPADEVARLYAFLITVSRYSQPWTVLLSKPELARRVRVWPIEDSIPRLRAFLGEPAYRTPSFLARGECVVTFRTWNWGNGSVEEWMGRLPAHHTSYFAKIPVSEGVTPRGVAARLSRSPTDPSGRAGSP